MARPGRNQNDGLRLDAPQRMKSANGFYDGKCYIRWNLSSVGEKTRGNLLSEMCDPVTWHCKEAMPQS
jgi:hypothetical protein